MTYELELLTLTRFSHSNIAHPTHLALTHHITEILNFKVQVMGGERLGVTHTFELVTSLPLLSFSSGVLIRLSRRSVHTLNMLVANQAYVTEQTGSSDRRPSLVLALAATSS